jgi:hypothetical protein
MFEAMQAKYPNLNLPIPQGVMSGTQRATRSLTRQVTAAAAAEETADDHLETAETDEGDEAIDTPAEHTAETDEGGEAIDTAAQAKKTGEDPPSTPAQARKATSRKRKSHSRRKSVSKKAKSKEADAVTEAEDATVEDVNEGEGENEDIVSIELTLYSSGRVSDLVKVFPPYDRTYQHDPLMPSMRPVSTIHRLPVTRALKIISKTE